MRHGDACNWHNGDGMPLTYDPRGGRYISSVRNNFRRKLVEEERVGKKGWSALICLCVAQLNTFGSVENLIRNWCCSACCTNFSSWECLPVTAIFFSHSLMHQQKMVRTKIIIVKAVMVVGTWELIISYHITLWSGDEWFITYRIASKNHSWNRRFYQVKAQST